MEKQPEGSETGNTTESEPDASEAAAAWESFERHEAQDEGEPDAVTRFHRDATEREKVLREAMKKVVVAAGGTEGDELERAKVEGRDVRTSGERLADWHRVHLVGLDHSVKDEESIRRKVAGYAAEDGKEGNPLANVKDAVRYTVQLPDATYTEGSHKAITALSALGYEPLSIRNAWKGREYRGVNTSWKEPVSGTAFEVQFHTPLSYGVKQRTHDAYSEQRLPETTEARKAELGLFQAALTHIVKAPAGSETIVGRNQSEGGPA
ncbi:hypothetical protein [Streptomyces sp. NPDC054961]